MSLHVDGAEPAPNSRSAAAEYRRYRVGQDRQRDDDTDRCDAASGGNHRLMVRARNGMAASEQARSKAAETECCFVGPARSLAKGMSGATGRAGENREKNAARVEACAAMGNQSVTLAAADPCGRVSHVRYAWHRGVDPTGLPLSASHHRVMRRCRA